VGEGDLVNVFTSSENDLNCVKIKEKNLVVSYEISKKSFVEL